MGSTTFSQNFEFIFFKQIGYQNHNKPIQYRAQLRVILLACLLRLDTLRLFLAMTTEWDLHGFICGYWTENINLQQHIFDLKLTKYDHALVLQDPSIKPDQVRGTNRLGQAKLSRSILTLRTLRTLTKAKKKNTLSQSFREFFKPRRHAVFNFLLLQLAFASTHIRNPKWLKSFNFCIFRNQTGFYTFFWAPTCLNSSKTANFLRFS